VTDSITINTWHLWSMVQQRSYSWYSRSSRWNSIRLRSSYQ